MNVSFGLSLYTSAGGIAGDADGASGNAIGGERELELRTYIRPVVDEQ